MSAAAATAGPAIEGSSGRSAWHRLSRYVAHHPAYYSAWLCLTLAYVAASTAIPLLVGWSVQAVVGALPADEVLRRVAWLAGLGTARAGLRYYTRVLAFNAARQIEYELRSDIFAQLERLPQSFYFRWRTGDIMSRCVNDINQIRLLMGMGLLQVVQTPILFVSFIVAMLMINTKLALLVLIPFPLFILVARGVGRSVHHWTLRTQEGLAEASNQLQETISGIAVVKAYAMEGVTAGRFAEVNEELYGRQLKAVRAFASLPAVGALLPALGMCIILLVGGNEIIVGNMEISEFFTFSMFVYEITFPAFLMGWVVALVQRGAAAIRRIDELMLVEPSIKDAPDLERVEIRRGEVEFRGLNFRYAGSAEGDATLRDIDLRVPAGTTLGVVGPVGSGKSTLASLIPRLYEVDAGQLFIDGVDVTRIPLRTLRSNIAMVPQEAFLFSTTLGENIAFGAPDASAERVAEAAERAQLAKDVADLPDGYDTIVGERGVMLSGGQRQRAALARALLLDPRILILDDTLSAVDAETEAAIQRGLEEVFEGRTVVVLASRVSTVRSADQIVVMNQGRIAECGTHDELLAADGIYARLASEQAEEERLRNDLEGIGAPA